MHFAAEHSGLPLPPIDHLAYNESVAAVSPALTPEELHYHQYNMESRGAYYRDYVPDHPFQMSSEDARLHEYMARNGELPPQNLPAMYSPVLYPQASPWHNFEAAFSMASLPSHIQSRNPKQKRARMSLQKRLLVNARERERMRVLNKAFEALRDALPCYIADGHMAKITTLRLAINYIRALTEVLNEQKTLEESQKELVEKAKEEVSKFKEDPDKERNVQPRSKERTSTQNSHSTNTVSTITKTEKFEEQAS